MRAVAAQVQLALVVQVVEVMVEATLLVLLVQQTLVVAVAAQA
jgi:hypothetical protein